MMGAFERKAPNLKRHEARIPVRDMGGAEKVNKGLGAEANTKNSQPRLTRKERGRKF